MRALLLPVVLTLASCAGPPDAEPVGPAEPLPAGLSLDQLDALRDLGVPVLVPGEVGTFDLVRFQADAGTQSYVLGYRQPGGACFEVSGAPRLALPSLPLVSTEAEVRDLGRSVRVYEAARDPGATSAQVWGAGTVVSEPVALDGAEALFLSDTAGACRPVSLAEGVGLVAGLRRLASGPAAPGALGAFAPADDLLADYNAASSPQVAADVLARRYDGEADRVTVEVLSQTTYEAAALVTALGLRDDSIRDERLRLVYAPYGGTWELVGAGRQVRCQPGRGHADWSADACL